MRIKDTIFPLLLQKPEFPEMMKYISRIFFLSFIISTCLSAQEKVVTVGFQYKPIFSSAFFKTGPIDIEQNNVNFNISPQSGYCFGMVIRKGITSQISIETAINYIKRNYELSISEGSFKGESDFSIIGYEIPFQGLVFIRLSEHIYMDAATGISMDFFPSDIFTQDISYFKNKGYRTSWVIPSLIANIGWEYRTPKSGYFYLGASYHRPFTNIYTSEVTYLPTNEIIVSKLSGNYMTVDLRYFFHEKPVQKKKKKKVVNND